MTKLRKGLLGALSILSLGAHTEHISVQGTLKAEFNVLEYWREGMSWDEFNVIKIPLQRKDLVKWMDKIEQQKMALSLGLKIPKTYIATREKVPLVALLSTLDTYVAKVTHMSWGEGLIIVKNGVNMLTGKRITPQEVEDKIYKSMKEQPRLGQPWALFHVPHGIMIQEYIPNRLEIKMLMIFGKMMVGDYRGGETDKNITPLLGRFDRDGNRIQGELQKAPWWWPEAIEYAERFAQGTDSLRVDFLIRENGEILLNELEFYPETHYMDCTKAQLIEAVDTGYRALKNASCSP